MNKNAVVKLSRRVLIGVLAVAMLVGVVFSNGGTSAASAMYEASHIQQLDKDSIAIDNSGYLDSSVVTQLPETIRPDDEISVIINLDQITVMEAYESSDKSMSLAEFALGSAEAAEINAAIAGEKERVLAALDELGISYTVGDDYNTLLCGFELRITAGDFEATCGVLGNEAQAVVCEEYAVCETELVENDVTIYETGIVDSSAVNYDGSGMVVAVLDTGLDYNHTAFSMDNFSSTKLGLTYEDVAAVLNDTVASTLAEGLTVDDVYISEKVPFGFDYADGDADPYSTYNNHGTHVSGIIVGKDDTITGVAPNAQLVSMKIFSDTYESAISSWILSALEDCVILGVDVINMSLGQGAGFSRESDEEVLNGVYQKIRDAGISLIVAASNSYSSAYGSEANGNLGLTSNPDTATVGSPSTYDGAMSVASINGVETPYLLYGKTIIYFDESNDNAGKAQDFVAGLLGEETSAELEYVIVPGVGRSADYTGLDVEGKIALVRRGDNTFEEKAMIAEAQGALGIIIYNNVSGEIKMNVGDATLAACSISQDDGEMLVAAGGGKLTVSVDQTSGPFIDEYSSWGPSPNLGLKPEITTHGGNILSSVTGGTYDRLSGTSMATPNLAGVTILLRQYVVENFPDIADDNVAVNQMVNRLLMSTADIILNKNGLPYSVRKQGAGNANLESCINTPAYIITYDDDGEMDKTKLELGDDAEKTGVYEMTFSICNEGDKNVTYELGSYVMTEGVSDTKTNAGKTTVTEEAYILEGAVTEITSVENGTLKGEKITVAGGESAKVTVTITLSDEDKAYLDESFANGMYVEGFITLAAASGTEIDLNVPFLAFYGDWTQAPMFDLTYYDTNADELDDAIAVEDKTMADAYATRPIGGLYDDYVSYLGSYYFLQDPDDLVISANEDYIALSNQEGTVHSLRFLWTGMLRNAARVEVAITNDATGEVVFETVDYDVRKSYGDGGSIYPANVEIEFDTQDYNLANNSEYTVTVTGYLDYEDGGADTNTNNTYTFPLTIDFEAPTISDVEFYYEYDDNAKKNRLYAKVAVYDNHYTMCMQVGYVGQGADEDGNEMPQLYAFEQYMTPVYSECDSTTYVTYELTDYIYNVKEGAITPNTFVVTVYDYAMNYATYEIGLPDEYESFYYEGLENGLTMSPNEVFSLEPVVVPDTEWAELLEFASSKPSVARVVNNKLVAVSEGVSTIRIRDPKTNESMTFTVTVLGEDDEGYRRYDQPVADTFTLSGYTTVNAHYIINNEDCDIGYTGDLRYFEGDYNLAMYPAEVVCLNYDLDAYFPKDTSVVYESSNESIVTVDAYGNVTAVAEGYASVTVKVLLNGRSTYYSETVSIEVKDPWVTTGATLTSYYGNGGLVTIPEDLDLQTIGSFSFANFDYVMKTEEELAFDDSSLSKQWYIGNSTITKVVIPEGVKTINSYAFANLTALEEVVLPSTLEQIDYGAFYGCTNLEKITFSGENNLKIINQSAFENCNLQDALELPSICVISDYAFAGNTKLESVTLGETLSSVGQYAFAGCKKLESITIDAAKVSYGDYCFTGCESLESFYVNTGVIPAGMFYECKSMTSVTIGPDVNSVGEYAFRTTKIKTFEVDGGNTAYQTGSCKYLISADGSKLCAVSPMYSGTFTASELGGAGVTTVGWGAFSHNTAITSVELPAVTTVEGYGFASCESLAEVKLGSLTAIGEYAFSETAITVAPAFTKDTDIGSYAFAFSGVTQVTIPDGMTLAEGVFSECYDLASVTIGNDVTIGDYAFYQNKDNTFEVAYDSEVAADGTETRYYRYVFSSALTELTIGDNAVIGENAFGGAASLETVTLGANAQIGKMAFYNNCALKNIDLSKAVTIGDYAFSGDVYYVCLDENMSVAAVGKDGYYMYSYHGLQLENVDLSSATSIGENAFSYCRALKSVTLNSEITELPQYVFAGCISLESISMPGVTVIGDYAFLENAFVTLDLSAVETVGEYAFVQNPNLTSVTLNPNGVVLNEGAFAECRALTQVENMGCITDVGSYSFAYTAVVDMDLTGAVNLGDQAFLKEEFTPVTVQLGAELTSVGDNPFAMCQLQPFSGIDEETGAVTDTYDISDSVHVIDGSLYCDVPNGMELIVYAGEELIDVQIAAGTVRICALAFAGTDVQMVTLPDETISIGHKAFYGCDDLQMVVFGAYYAPVLEEEFDSAYYESLLHIPGTGNFGEYTDYDGTNVSIDGMGLLPYYMWNVTDGMYSNVFYGANFVDYVGYVSDKLTMVRPVNGEEYDSYIYNQYFDLVIDGAAGADDVTLAAIRAIDAIPDRVTLEDADLVTAARTAYNKIATTLQQALVVNYADLITAEQRITALSTAEEEGEGDVEGEVIVEEEPADPVKLQKTVNGLVAIIILIVIAAVLCGWMVMSKLGIRLGSEKDDSEENKSDFDLSGKVSAAVGKVKQFAAAAKSRAQARAEAKAKAKAEQAESGEEEAVSEEENDEASVQ